MSVLSIFEATPNRVRSLARLAAHLGSTSRDVLRENLMPTKDDSAQFGNLLRETIRLGLLVEEQKGPVTLASTVKEADVTDDGRFRKFVETALFGPDVESSENRSFRYALSWLLAQPSGLPIQWNSDQHLQMEKQMEGSDNYDVTNKERFAMLCYWARFLGYAASINMGGHSVVIPDPSDALERQLPDIFSDSPRITCARFFDRLGRRCPVLEGGKVRGEVEARLREKRPGNQISISTGLALWRLEERKLIKLDHLSDAETWVMSTSIVTIGAGASRLVSHVECMG
jgi:hypothetical protein